MLSRAGQHLYRHDLGFVFLTPLRMLCYFEQVNLPGSLKMTRPRIQLAGKDTESPLPVVHPSKGTDVVVVAGEVEILHLGNLSIDWTDQIDQIDHNLPL